MNRDSKYNAFFTRRVIHAWDGNLLLASMSIKIQSDTKDLWQGDKCPLLTVFKVMSCFNIINCGFKSVQWVFKISINNATFIRHLRQIFIRYFIDWYYPNPSFYSWLIWSSPHWTLKKGSENGSSELHFKSNCGKVQCFGPMFTN